MASSRAAIYKLKDAFLIINALISKSYKGWCNNLSSLNSNTSFDVNYMELLFVNKKIQVKRFHDMSPGDLAFQFMSN
jgi:hypothetical protein